MNFLYYKNFGEEKQVSYSSYRKKKYTPKKTHYRDDTAGEITLISRVRQVDINDRTEGHQTMGGKLSKA